MAFSSYPLRGGLSSICSASCSDGDTEATGPQDFNSLTIEEEVEDGGRDMWWFPVSGVLGWLFFSSPLPLCQCLRQSEKMETDARER